MRALLNSLAFLFVVCSFQIAPATSMPVSNATTALWGFIDISQTRADIDITVNDPLGSVTIVMVNSTGGTVYQETVSGNPITHNIDKNQFEAGTYQLTISDGAMTEEVSVTVY